MSQNIQSQELKLKYSFIEFIKKECILTIALTLAVISSFISAPKMSYIDFKVLILLFNLMIVVAAFKELKVLDNIAVNLLKKCNTYTSISLALVFITFVSSMIVTNDVALITFVPLSIVIGRKANINVLKVVILQTLAANLGSSFTPMGNPQNLFIYSFYNLSPMDFFKITLPVVVLSILFLVFLIFKGKKMDLSLDLEDVKINNKRDVYLFSLLFLIILSSVFHIIDYRFTFLITIITVFILNKNLFSQVDYSLLVTFVGFFIFVGNMSTMDVVKNFMYGILGSPQSTFLSSVISSQFISNVPATMLLSGFTDQFKELLLGVNIGGMGTLIASLASVISYKIYTSEFGNDNYIRSFTFYNVLGLAVFVPLVYGLISKF
ncbi:MAG: SLC13 family permease [Terrisporobacter othiniensis]|uniref:SLC13 family permease n=1 Tax=Terrisporobacter petrolearius TaxID=1460447 RepID=UPI0022E4ED35|nr:SLC13 family permease [Terrisporobacter petrolearius]MDU4861584.1 SLC13 family permease [Terrisporobacter othiniensis]MDU6995497.1 SLC13 family permease [Terrisporobacter othiniensis]